MPVWEVSFAYLTLEYLSRCYDNQIYFKAYLKAETQLWRPKACQKLYLLIFLLAAVTLILSLSSCWFMSSWEPKHKTRKQLQMLIILERKQQRKTILCLLWLPLHPTYHRSLTNMIIFTFLSVLIGEFQIESYQSAIFHKYSALTETKFVWHNLPWIPKISESINNADRRHKTHFIPFYPPAIKSMHVC